MEQTYAQALRKMAEGDTSPKRAVEGLRRALEKHGRVALLPRIARAFGRIAAREDARRAVSLSVARDKDTEKAMREARDILKELGVAEREVAVRVDETLIGGWRLEGRGHLLDASYKKQLLTLYNRTIQ